MSKPLDEMYIEWLYSLIANPRQRSLSRSYWTLTHALYIKEFVWTVANDDNRCEDGRELRDEFIALYGLTDVDPNWRNLGCSMLEMLIGLSRRTAFEAEGRARDWFWHLLGNVGLNEYNDSYCKQNMMAEREIDHILERIIWRLYDENGKGGLFPLRHPPQNQRATELWYQLCAYVIENTI